MGWFTNPKRALYNRIYSRTTRGCLIPLLGLGGALLSLALLLVLQR